VSRDLVVVDVVDHDECVPADDIDIDGLSAHFHSHVASAAAEVINEDDAEDNLYAAAPVVPNKDYGDPSTVMMI
jgi:hypothetical protein